MEFRFIDGVLAHMPVRYAVRAVLAERSGYAVFLVEDSANGGGASVLRVTQFSDVELDRDVDEAAGAFTRAARWARSNSPATNMSCAATARSDPDAGNGRRL